MKPLLEFTIQADANTHLRFRILVWKSYGQLQIARRNAKKISGDEPDSRLCDAFCYGFHRRSSSDLVLGELHFCKDKLTVDNIAHESVHAAAVLAMWDRPCSRELDRRDANERDLCLTEKVIEESIAYPTGHLTEGIIVHLRENKFKVKPL